ncbi:ABC transporter permease [Mesorhizobium sp. 113-3-3]|uniref:ABC transporter permease n=1 Tax=Mesorhizobium sp. 113-3-3 TaxID=2744516 RepID=UPI00192761EB|nr:ABC transporter permease [Mesorhizobium sp. 113-3-3]BCG82120.1 sugar ABC transporter permease [Mesorhizobium sp. 113-3-3]
MHNLLLANRRKPDWAVSVLVLTLSTVVLWLLLPGFFRAANVASEIRTSLPTLCLAMGQMIIVSARGIDLSLGALLSLASSVMVWLFGSDPTWQVSVVAISAGIGVAVAGGATNGLLVAYFRVQPVIATFATSFVWAGLALWALPQPGGVVPEGLSSSLRVGAWAPLVVILAIGAVWLQFSRSSRYRGLLAVGGEPVAATNSGLNLGLVQFWTYVAAGLLTGISAVLLSADISSGDPLIGASLTLPTIVAVVIGGTKLTGGNATYVGTVAGILLLIVLRNIVFAVGLPYEWQPLIDSVLILAMLAVGAILNLRRKK